MKYAFIERDRVTTVYDERPELHPDFLVVEAPDDVAEGWVYEGGALSAPPPPVVVIPDRCSKLGLKRALSEIDLWETVKAALAADPDMQEDWDLAVEIRRADPLTQSLITSLDLTPEQVGAIIIRAVEIVA